MRDFRDAKAMARTLRQALAAKGLAISNSESLELVAQSLGARDWNTLAALIQAEPPATAEAPAAAAPAPDPPAPPPGAPAPTPASRQGFSPELETSLYRAVASASARGHSHTTVEHLLASLLDDPDARAVMAACAVDLATLRQSLTGFLDGLKLPPPEPDWTQAPTDAFHRVVRRAVIHVQSAGRYPVTGANVLVAIFSERESHAARFLAERGMDRYDAVNFIAHGVVKKGGAAA